MVPVFYSVVVPRGRGIFQDSFTEGTAPVPVPDKRFRQFQFRLQFLENGSDSVPFSWSQLGAWSTLSIAVILENHSR